MDSLFYGNPDEYGKSSIEHCKNSDFKYYIYYITGYNYTYPDEIYPDNGVSMKIFKLKM